MTTMHDGRSGRFRLEEKKGQIFTTFCVHRYILLMKKNRNWVLKLRVDVILWNGEKHLINLKIYLIFNKHVLNMIA